MKIHIHSNKMQLQSTYVTTIATSNTITTSTTTTTTTTTTIKGNHNCNHDYMQK